MDCRGRAGDHLKLSIIDSVLQEDLMTAYTTPSLVVCGDVVADTKANRKGTGDGLKGFVIGVGSIGFNL